MKVKRTLRQAPFFFIFLFLCVIHCHREKKIDPETELLNFFKEELALLEEYQDGSYADYMAQENERFEKHQPRINDIIARINTHFDAIDNAKKSDYQFQWRDEFQPVVSEIYIKTKDLVVKTTKSLTAQKMATIKELSMVRKSLEKKISTTKLKPLFFEIPAEDEEVSRE